MANSNLIIASKNKTMNADNVRLYEEISNRSKDQNLRIKLEGENFSLYNKEGGMLGVFADLNDLANYIYGYEAGFSKGFCTARGKKYENS